jgi:hypothetical protein
MEYIVEDYAENFKFWGNAKDLIDIAILCGAYKSVMKVLNKKFGKNGNLCTKDEINKELYNTNNVDNYVIYTSDTSGIGQTEKSIKKIISELGEGFSISSCEWVAYEVYRKLGKDVERYMDFPGIRLKLLHPNTNYGQTICIRIFSADNGKVWFSGSKCDNQLEMTPEEAVDFILDL